MKDLLPRFARTITLALPAAVLALAGIVSSFQVACTNLEDDSTQASDAIGRCSPYNPYCSPYDPYLSP